jgi:hypothetical protein
MISLIIPTRGRREQLIQLLEDLREKTKNPDRCEILLVIDHDDPGSQVDIAGLSVKHVVGPPGRTMGQLNWEGVLAATHDWVFLLNDDVECKTPEWDEWIQKAISRYSDQIGLIHVNDTLMKTNLCVFPILCRRLFIDYPLCPTEYVRYRIDDHIEDVFLRLNAYGENRILYISHVVFQHKNVTIVNGHEEYQAIPEILAIDAITFERYERTREAIAKSLWTRIVQNRIQSIISKVQYPVKLNREPQIAIIRCFKSVRELNLLIDASESDFVVISTSGKYPKCLTIPFQNSLKIGIGYIVVDRAVIGPKVFDERFHAYFFEIDLAIRHHLHVPEQPTHWIQDASREIYNLDYIFFSKLHPTFNIKPNPPGNPRIWNRMIQRWKHSGILGLLNSFVNAVLRKLFG